MKKLPIAAAAALAVLSSGLLAQVKDAAPRNAHYNLAKDGLALDGYDPVAYFPEGGGKAAKGDEKLTATHAGAAYRFATERNRAAFLQNPARYQPAYGGWCAWAMSDGKGDKVDVDPKSFLIEEGRLLLFYDGFLADTRKKWSKKGGQKLHPTADANWKRISGEPVPRELVHWDLDAGLALGGYDPVAYFSAGATKGEAVRCRTHAGVTYRFASEENLAAFDSDPTRYEPRYGGWCAYAMSKGKKVAVDPEAFLIEDGALLLFKTKALRDEWKTKSAGLGEAADKNWTVLHEG